MKVYCFQFRDSKYSTLDDITIAESIDKCKENFKKRYDECCAMGFELVEYTEPEDGDDCRGYFQFKDSSGLDVVGSICDYHTFS